MPRQHPAGRRGRRGTQHHLQAPSSQGVNRSIQPIEGESVWRRFETGPCEFADPNTAQARIRHTFGIFGPEGFRPVFWVVANAERTLHLVSHASRLQPFPVDDPHGGGHGDGQVYPRLHECGSR